MTSKYKIGFCELFHPNIHGFTSRSDPNVINSYLVMITMEPIIFFDTLQQIDNYSENHHTSDYSSDYSSDYNSEFDNDYLEYINELNNNMIGMHPNIRNYFDINKKQEGKVQIIETNVLLGGELVGCIKTFWIKIIQRKWKKIFKKKQELILERKKIKNLMKREIYGKF